MTAADRAYLAGIFDARASVLSAVTGGENVSVRVAITSQDYTWLTEVQALAGDIGTISTVRRRDRVADSYSWIVRKHADLAQLIKLVKPYVRAKGWQLDLAEESLRHRGGKVGNPTGYARLLAIRDELNIGA